jgi:hypothetical protein
MRPRAWGSRRLGIEEVTTLPPPAPIEPLRVDFRRRRSNTSVVLERAPNPENAAQSLATAPIGSRPATLPGRHTPAHPLLRWRLRVPAKERKHVLMTRNGNGSAWFSPSYCPVPLMEQFERYRQMAVLSVGLLRLVPQQDACCLVESVTSFVAGHPEL